MNDNLMERINRLEERAGKATQGEWEIKHNPEDAFDYATAFIITEKRLSDYKAEIAEISYYNLKKKENPFVEEQIANAEFIAAANPAMIQEMIAEMRRLEKEVNWLGQWCANHDCPHGCPSETPPFLEECKDCWRKAAQEAVKKNEKE